MTREDLYKFHERVLIDSPKVGDWCCYYCQTRFQAEKAIDEGSDSWHCPNCGLDTTCREPLTNEQLSQMNNYWFLHGRAWLRGSGDEMGDRFGPTICYAKEKPCFRCDILKEVDSDGR
jgi:hypothetical protein